MKKFLTALAVVVVCCLVFFAFNGKGKNYIAHVMHKAQPVVYTVRVGGTLSVKGGHIIITTTDKQHAFILVTHGDNKLKESIAQAEAKKKNVVVIGELLQNSFEFKDGAIVIKHSINVTNFNAESFDAFYKTGGGAVPADVMAAIRKKITERKDFREATLKKLGLKDEKLEVVGGKLSVINTASNVPEEQTFLTLVDKYGDTYLIYDKRGQYKPFSKFNKFKNKELNLIAVGQVTLPDNLQVQGKEEFIPFDAQKLYNTDLTEFKAE